MKYNFVAIPRNGSTSISSLLGIPVEHVRASEVPAPRFAVVRHPWHRACSAYRQALTNPHSLAKECLGKAKSFREFLLQDNLLTWSQSYWLNDSINIMLRFENLSEDYKMMFNNYLPHMNKSPNIDIGNDTCDDLIESLYQEDFERFNYVS